MSDSMDAVYEYEAARGERLDVNFFWLTNDEWAQLEALIRGALAEGRELTEEELAPFRKPVPDDMHT